MLTPGERMADTRENSVGCPRVTRKQNRGRSQPRLGQWLVRSEQSWVSGGSVLLWNEWAHGGREHCSTDPSMNLCRTFGWAESQAHKWIYAAAAAETAAQIMTRKEKAPEKPEVLGENG